MNRRFEDFSTIMFRITHYWNKLATEEMKVYNLKGGYALYLLILANCEEEMTAATLAKICGRDKADVSRAISTMQKREIIEPFSKGAYRAPLRLTENGKQLAEKIQKRADLALALAGEGLEEEKREAMYESLSAIVDNLKRLTEEGIER
ncbi:MAG: hypothetical protein E7277_04160 [Lachnospiraceae bacterium]|jgi:DNA-binding MarR family transcriptional regulator|nr:hypothetical protein [Lachnospiraceae bacterium]MBE5905976.1 hypothetical protein [Lachnospiraceae bacterium]